MSFLAIDIGNTRLKWALFDHPAPGQQPLAHGAVFLETIDQLADTDWAGLPPPRGMLGCVVAGEAVRRRVEEQMEMWDVTPRWVVPASVEAGVVNGYDHPARLGADRWVALVGARARVL
ncbi:MAG TPA: type III pantothenate kinase, partial [Burkholderiaceae bacterium]